MTIYATAADLRTAALSAAVRHGLLTEEQAAAPNAIELLDLALDCFPGEE